MVSPISASDKYNVNPLTDTVGGAGMVLVNLFKCLISDPLSSIYFIPKKIQDLEHDITYIKNNLSHDIEKDKMAIGQLHEKILERDRLSLEGAGFKEHAKDIGRGLFRILPIIYPIYCAIMFDRYKWGEKFLKWAKEEKDPTTAIDFYTRAAELGNASAQFKLASHHYAKKEDDTAIKYLDKAAKQDHSRALHARGEMHDKKQEYQKAFSLYLKASIADKNSAISLLNLSRMYYGGKGTQQNDAKAFEYALVAAQMGNTHAYYDLGLMYQEGIGVGIDLNKAVHYLSQAAYNNVPLAQVDLKKANSLLTQQIETKNKVFQAKLLAEQAQNQKKDANWYGSMGNNFDQLVKLYT